MRDSQTEAKRLGVGERLKVLETERVCVREMEGDMERKSDRNMENESE